MPNKKYSDYIKRRMNTDDEWMNMVRNFSDSELRSVEDIVMATPEELVAIQLKSGKKDNGKKAGK